jgi:hypothetical protein
MALGQRLMERRRRRIASLDSLALGLGPDGLEAAKLHGVGKNGGAWRIRAGAAYRVWKVERRK